MLGPGQLNAIMETNNNQQQTTVAAQFWCCILRRLHLKPAGITAARVCPISKDLFSWVTKAPTGESFMAQPYPKIHFVPVMKMIRQQTRSDRKPEEYTFKCSYWISASVEHQIPQLIEKNILRSHVLSRLCHFGSVFMVYEEMTSKWKAFSWT